MEKDLLDLFGEMETLYSKTPLVDEFDQHVSTLQFFVHHKLTQLQKNQIKSCINSDPDRTRLLSLAKQNRQMSLQMVFPVEEFLENRLSYITSGSFGSVMVYQSGRRRRPQAVKLINCLPQAVAFQMHQSGMRYGDIYREAMCMYTLGKLVTGVRSSKVIAEKAEGEAPYEREEDADNLTQLLGDLPVNAKLLGSSTSAGIHYKASCFPQLYGLYLVDASNAIFSLQSFFTITPGVATYPAFEKALLSIEHCGMSLHGKLMEPSFVGEQAASVAKQVVLGLVTAEQAFHFEHRDLHVSNLMVASAKARTVTFIIGGTRYSLPTHGVEAKIIDFSYARLETADGETLYKNLDSLFEEEVEATGETKKDHFDGYRDMFNARGGGGVNWKLYSPGSNLAWVKRFLSEMLQLMAYTIKEMTSSHSSSTCSKAEAAYGYMAKMLKLTTRCLTTEHFLVQLLGEEFNDDTKASEILVPITVKRNGVQQ